MRHKQSEKKSDGQMKPRWPCFVPMMGNRCKNTLLNSLLLAKPHHILKTAEQFNSSKISLLFYNFPLCKVNALSRLPWSQLSCWYCSAAYQKKIRDDFNLISMVNTLHYSWQNTYLMSDPDRSSVDNNQMLSGEWKDETANGTSFDKLGLSLHLFQV